MSKSYVFYKENCSNKIPKLNNQTDIDKKLLNELKDDIPNLINLMNNQNLNDYIKKSAIF